MIALADQNRPGYSECIGCRLCVLPCPVWRETHDIELTLAGRALALQRGVPVAELAASLEHCVLCGACEPVCPVNIDTVGMTLELRRRLRAEGGMAWSRAAVAPAVQPGNKAGGAYRWLPGSAWRADPSRTEAMSRLLLNDGFRPAADDGADVAVALEAGHPVGAERWSAFIGSLDGVEELVVGDGLLHAPLRRALPEVPILGPGEALLRIPSIRTGLRPGDLYVIDSRVLHADHARLVRFYDRLRVESGCSMNLDLQRMAIATGAASLQARLQLPESAGRTVDQARWILEGRTVTRILVENPLELAPFQALGIAPVVHLAELAGGAS